LHVLSEPFPGACSIRLLHTPQWREGKSKVKVANFCRGAESGMQRGIETSLQPEVGDS